MRCVAENGYRYYISSQINALPRLVILGTSRYILNVLVFRYSVCRIGFLPRRALPQAGEIGCVAENQNGNPWITIATPPRCFFLASTDCTAKRLRGSIFFLVFWFFRYPPVPPGLLFLGKKVPFVIKGTLDKKMNPSDGLNRTSTILSTMGPMVASPLTRVGEGYIFSQCDVPFFLWRVTRPPFREPCCNGARFEAVGVAANDISDVRC